MGCKCGMGSRWKKTTHLRLHGFPAVRAKVGILEPRLDASVTEHVLATRNADRRFGDLLGRLDAELVVADVACWKKNGQLGLLTGQFGRRTPLLFREIRDRDMF